MPASFEYAVKYQIQSALSSIFRLVLIFFYEPFSYDIPESVLNATGQSRGGLFRPPRPLLRILWI